MTAGLVKDRAAANTLRQKIESEGQTVDEYIAAQAQASHLGSGNKPVASNIAELGEVRALMNQEGLSYPLAVLLRRSIVSGGQSVADFIGADAQTAGFGSVGGINVNPLTVFRQAQSLVNLAGGRDKAIKAVELITSLDLTTPGEEAGNAGGGGQRGGGRRGG